jgi:hypothetical protein
MWLRRFLLTIALAMALVPGSAADADLNYRVDITGAEDSELADLLDSAPWGCRTTFRISNP